MAQFVHHRTSIPAWLAKGIGHIAAEWSALEWELEDTIRILLAIDIGNAKIATTGMNMKSRFTTATNLTQAYLLQKAIPVELCEELINIERRVRNVEEDRNKYVHGLWGLVEGKWYLLWQRQQRAVSDFGKRAHGKPLKLRRAVLPTLDPVTDDKMQSVRLELKACVAVMDAYRKKLEAALPPSPHKSPRQLKQTFPPRKRKPKQIPPP